MNGVNADRFGQVANVGSFLRAIPNHFAGCKQARRRQWTRWWRTIRGFSQQFQAERLGFKLGVRIPTYALHEQSPGQSCCTFFPQVYRNGWEVCRIHQLRQLSTGERNSKETSRALPEMIAVFCTRRIVDEGGARMGVTCGGGNIASACG